MSLIDELDRVTPTAASADYVSLARRGRRRHHVTRILATSGVIALVVVLGGRFLAPPTTSVELAAGPVDAGTAAAPAGTWKDLPPLPDGPRLPAFAGQLSDGRGLVFGGQRGLDGASTLQDGWLFDPASATWEQLPASPLGSRPFPFVRLAGDRLLLWGGNDGTADGAVWDAATGAWTVIDEPPPDVAFPRLAGWDGERLVVIGPADESEAALEQASHLALWTAGTGTWEELPPSPLGGDAVVTAFDDGRLAVVGRGAAGGLSCTEARECEALEGEGPAAPDGAAVLSLSTRAWNRLQWDGTLAGAGAVAAAWIDEGLAMVPTIPVGDAGLPAAIVVDRTGQARLLPEPPLDRTTSIAGGADVLAGSSVLTIEGALDGAPVTSALTADGTWTSPVRGAEVVRAGGELLATSVGGEFPGLGTPLGIWRWTGTAWQRLTDERQANRSSAAVVPLEDGILVAGGWSVRTPEPGEDPDAIPTEPDEPGPYVIDVHDDALLLELDPTAHE